MQYTSAGKRFPDAQMMKVLSTLLDANPHGFLLDGFPRTQTQAALLSELTPVDRVVHITMREDLLVRKLLGRRMCGTCGTSWNVEDVNEDGIVMPPMMPEGSTCSASCTLALHTGSLHGRGAPHADRSTGEAQLFFL